MQKSKPTITYISRKNNRIEIKFKKTQMVIDFILKLLQKLEIKEEFEEYKNKKGDINKKKFLQEDQYKYIEDYKENYIEKTKIHIFVGHKKIIITIDCEDKKQETVMKLLSLECKWKA